MKLIPVRARGMKIVAYAEVDDIDYDRLMLWKWHLTPDGYANRAWLTESDGVRSTTMHRQILGLQHGERFYGDHINRDRLDNRRSNLRIVTPEESSQNRGPRKKSRSRFRGVNYVPTTGKWIARVRLGSRLHNLGTYESEEEAALVAAEFRAEHMPHAVEVLAP